MNNNDLLKVLFLTSRVMTNARFIIAMILIASMFSCERSNSNDLIQSPFEYGKFSEYEEFTSNIEKSVASAYFIDDKNGFATENGVILKTMDGGLTWTSNYITDLPLNAICFVDNKIGFAVGGESSCGGTGCTPPGSVIYKTNDSGDNWTKLNIPYEWSELNSVSFINENIGFAIGLGLQIKTIDGGETWELFEFESKGFMSKVAFVNSQTGFCAGLSGNIFKTSNQGEDWIKTVNESDGHIYDFCFVNEKVGYACGQREIVKTIDGGESWRILTNSPSELYFIHFSDAENGIAIGYGHYTGGCFGTWTKAIYWTNNGGLTWKMEDDIEFGYSTSFYNKNEGYSIANGKTYKIICK